MAVWRPIFWNPGGKDEARVNVGEILSLRTSMTRIVKTGRTRLGTERYEEKLLSSRCNLKEMNDLIYVRPILPVPRLFCFANTLCVAGRYSGLSKKIFNVCFQIRICSFIN